MASVGLSRGTTGGLGCERANRGETGQDTSMQALKAQVRNGQFVIDERTDLPEGTEVELQLVKVADAFADMAPEDREELEEAIEEGFRDFENGDHIGAREFLAQLRAKNA